MARLSWGVCRRDESLWVTVDFETSPDPTQAKPFGTHERAAQFIRIHLAAESAHWTPKPIPQPEGSKVAA